MPMTSKERVSAALRRGQPDRVPMNYIANNHGIDVKVKEALGLAPDDSEGLLRRPGIDFRYVLPAYTGPRLHPEIPGRSVDPCYGFRTRWVENPSGGYWDYCDFPLADADEETVARWPMPSPDDYDYAGAAAAARRWPDLALHAGNPGLVDILNKTGFIRGPAQVYMDLIDDNPAFLLYTDRRLAVQLEVVARTIEACKGALTFMWMGEDLGTQIGPLISLECYRRHIRPRQQRFVDLAKSHNLPVMIHCCGSSSWAFEDFIEMGIDCVDTLQPEAAHMAPRELKDRFGGRLAFHGAISTAGPVVAGTLDEVRQSVRDTLDILKPGGGYLLAPTHSWQDNSRPENILAVYETALAHGGY